MTPLAETRSELPFPQLAAVPGGRFLMGSDQGRPDEAPVREIELTPFLLGRTPVTVAEYAAFLATGRVEEPPWWSHAAFNHPLQPVVGITWFEAVAYTQWLSLITGRCFRLPSEAEWERAARGGLEGAPTPWGAVVPEGEIPEGPVDGPWLVGRGTPNAFGLLDMGTIVHEWCLDWYKNDGEGSSSPPTSSRPQEGMRRASRGGSWRHHVRFSSPSARSSLPPGLRYADYGFRILRDDA